MNNDKYKLTSNNYFNTIFLGIVLISSAFIFSRNITLHEEKAPILETSTNIEAIDEITLINDLTNYLFDGDENYLDMYSTNSKDELSNENKLRIAYEYINKTVHLNEFNEIVKCSDYNLDCDEVVINTYVNKESLKETVKKIFNEDITEFVDFKIANENECLYQNDEYLCTENNTEINNTKKAYNEVINYSFYDDKVVVLIKHSYFDTNNYYKSINGAEIGSEKYQIIFRKNDENYYWESTEKID